MKSTYKLLNEQLAELPITDLGAYAIPPEAVAWLMSRGDLVLVNKAELVCAQELALHVETSAFIRMGEWLLGTAVKDAMKLAESSALALSVPVTPVQAVEEVRRNIQEEVDGLRPKPLPNPVPGGADRQRGPVAIVGTMAPKG